MASKPMFGGGPRGSAFKGYGKPQDAPGRPMDRSGLPVGLKAMAGHVGAGKTTVTRVGPQDIGSHAGVQRLGAAHAARARFSSGSGDQPRDDHGRWSK